MLAGRGSASLGGWGWIASEPSGVPHTWLSRGSGPGWPRSCSGSQRGWRGDYSPQAWPPSPRAVTGSAALWTALSSSKGGFTSLSFLCLMSLKMTEYTSRAFFLLHKSPRTALLNCWLLGERRSVWFHQLVLLSHFGFISVSDHSSAGAKDLKGCLSVA